MDVLRTPDSAFENLPDYPFSPHYHDVDCGTGKVRMHYLDEGPKDAPVVLMLHGEPSWSFLYRHMIPPVVAAGYRVIAPDLIGFGKSDKPASRQDYTYQHHLDWLWQTIDALNLREVNLMCQDWGGLLGLRLVAEHPETFASVTAANTLMPTGDEPKSEAFAKWREFSQTVPEFHAGGIIKGGTVQPMTEAVIAAYNAPYPDETYKEGARQFPMLVPTESDNPASEANRRAWQALSQWHKPFLTAFSDSDPITQGLDKVFQSRIPGAKGQPHTTIQQGGHFLQEDQGPALAAVLIDFLNQQR